MDDGIMGMARDELIPWPGLNPRTHFDETALEELRASLRADGMIQPVGVRVNDEPPHWIWAGERRWRAAEGILERVPVIVRNIDESVALRLALTENMARNDLTPMEEARGMERYLEHSGAAQKDLAFDLGRTPSWVSNRLRLLKLTPALQELLDDGIVNPTQARDLILPFASLREDLWLLVADLLEREVGWPEDEPVDDGWIRQRVTAVLIPVSGWVAGPVWGKEHPPHAELWDELRTDLEAQPPVRTAVSYAWEAWNGDKKTVRVFDLEWWSEAVASAIEEQKAKDLERGEEPETIYVDDVYEPEGDGPIELGMGTTPWWMNPIAGEPRWANDPVVRYDIREIDRELVRPAIHMGKPTLVFLSPETYAAASKAGRERLEKALQTELQDQYIEELALVEDQLMPLSLYTNELVTLAAIGRRLSDELIELGYLPTSIHHVPLYQEDAEKKYLETVQEADLDQVAIQKILRLILHRLSAGSPPFIARKVADELEDERQRQLIAYVNEHWPEVLGEGETDGDL